MMPGPAWRTRKLPVAPGPPQVGAWVLGDSPPIFLIADVRSLITLPQNSSNSFSLFRQGTISIVPQTATKTKISQFLSPMISTGLDVSSRPPHLATRAPRLPASLQTQRVRDAKPAF